MTVKPAISVNPISLIQIKNVLIALKEVMVMILLNPANFVIKHAKPVLALVILTASLAIKIINMINKPIYVFLKKFLKFLMISP